MASHRLGKLQVALLSYAIHHKAGIFSVTNLRRDDVPGFFYENHALTITKEMEERGYIKGRNKYLMTYEITPLGREVLETRIKKQPTLKIYPYTQ